MNICQNSDFLLPSHDFTPGFKEFCVLMTSQLPYVVRFVVFSTLTLPLSLLQLLLFIYRNLCAFPDYQMGQ